MAKVNYRHLKKRREEEQKKHQANKQLKRGRVPDAPHDIAPQGPEGGPPIGGLPPRPGSA